MWVEFCERRRRMYSSRKRMWGSSNARLCFEFGEYINYFLGPIKDSNEHTNTQTAYSNFLPRTLPPKQMWQNDRIILPQHSPNDFWQGTVHVYTHQMALWFCDSVTDRLESQDEVHLEWLLN